MEAPLTPTRALEVGMWAHRRTEGRGQFVACCTAPRGQLRLCISAFLTAGNCNSWSNEEVGSTLVTYTTDSPLRWRVGRHGLGRQVYG